MNYFQNKRYVTKGIVQVIPSHLITVMWNIVEHLPIEEKDYLQIFELEVVGNSVVRLQVIKHRQEEPSYMSPVLYIPCTECFAGKVYIIDDGTASVMCFPEER